MAAYCCKWRACHYFGSIITELEVLQSRKGYRNLHHIHHWCELEDQPRIEIFSELCVGDLNMLTESNKTCFTAGSNRWDTLVSNLADTVDYIHSMNMVHLDIKPSNVLWSRYTGNFSQDVYSFKLTDYDMLSSTDQDNVYALFEAAPRGVQHLGEQCHYKWLQGVDLYAFRCTILAVLPELQGLMKVKFEIVPKLPKAGITEQQFDDKFRRFKYVKWN